MEDFTKMDNNPAEFADNYVFQRERKVDSIEYEQNWLKGTQSRCKTN